MMNNLENKISGALYGIAVGDALGGPLEFMDRQEIKEKHGYVTEMIGGGWLRLAPGETTDDTAMTLAVAEGIIEAPDDPVSAIGKRFIEWLESGPKDVGLTCSLSIHTAEAIKRGEYPTSDEWDKAAHIVSLQQQGKNGGNGALMRTVYPGLYYRDVARARDVARIVGRMTHKNDDSEKACQLYTDMIHLITHKNGEKADAFRLLRGSSYDVQGIAAGGIAALKPTGFVVSSLECALYCFGTAPCFADAVATAANLGGDADTIAAITGGLAGAYYGFDSIPARWVEALSDSDRRRLKSLIEAANESVTKT